MVINIRKLRAIISKFFVSLILVPFIGTEVKGSKRWLDIFFLPRFQPIEILKPFIIIIYIKIPLKKKRFLTHQKLDLLKY